MFTASDAKLAAHIAEYVRLKEEQIRRISDRDHLLYANLASIAAVWAFTFEHPSYGVALLSLPIVSFVLGSLHLANDLRISSIGRYVSQSLRAEIELSAEIETPTIFRWERFHRTESSRRLVKGFELLAVLLAFIVPGIAGNLFALICRGLKSPLQLAGNGAGIILLLGLAIAFVKEGIGHLNVYADETIDVPIGPIDT